MDATLSIWGTGKFSSMGSPDIHVADATPGANNSLATSDYGNVGSTSFGSVSYSGYNTSGYNDIALNASGLANINTTGISRFSLRLSWDILNDTTGLAWASNGQTYFVNRMADFTGTTNDPKLTINYTVVTVAQSTTAVAATLERQANGTSALSATLDKPIMNTTALVSLLEATSYAAIPMLASLEKTHSNPIAVQTTLAANALGTVALLTILETSSTISAVAVISQLEMTVRGTVSLLTELTLSRKSTLGIFTDLRRAGNETILSSEPVILPHSCAPTTMQFLPRSTTMHFK